MNNEPLNIRFVDGDMFSIPADILVNTVNCVGVMGAGVAAEFKKRYPEMYKDYVNRCRRKELKPGCPYLWQNPSMFGEGKEELIINFPTKDNWRDPSKYEYVEDGLIRMRDLLSHADGRTVVMPAVGCGHGGLNWERIKAMIVRYLSDVNANFVVTEPKNSQQTEELSDKERSFMHLKNIGMYAPSDEDYPATLKGRSSAVLYYRGNVDWVNDNNTIAIINSNDAKAEERVVLGNLLDKIANEQPEAKLVLFIRSMSDMDVLKGCFERKMKVIMLIPEGIMHMKLRPDVKLLWDDKLVLLISTQSPDKEYQVSAASQIRRLQILIGHEIDIIAADTKYLYYYGADLQRQYVCYVSYQGRCNKMLETIGAKILEWL